MVRAARVPRATKSGPQRSGPAIFLGGARASRCDGRAVFCAVHGRGCDGRRALWIRGVARRGQKRPAGTGERAGADHGGRPIPRRGSLGRQALRLRRDVLPHGRALTARRHRGRGWTRRVHHLPVAPLPDIHVLRREALPGHVEEDVHATEEAAGARGDGGGRRGARATERRG